MRHIILIITLLDFINAHIVKDNGKGQVEATRILEKSNMHTDDLYQYPKLGKEYNYSMFLQESNTYTKYNLL